MRTTSIVSAVIAASLGFGTLAQADTGRHERGQDNDRHEGGKRQERQDRQDGYGHRDQRWDGRRQQHDGVQQHARPQTYQQNYPQYQQRSYATPGQYHGGDRYDGGRQHYGVQAHGGQPYYGGYDAPRYVRGGYMPRQYLARNYWVNDWRARRLAPPPYGYQWVQSDAGEVILVALATGLIANVLFNQ